MKKLANVMCGIPGATTLFIVYFTLLLLTNYFLKKLLHYCYFTLFMYYLYNNKKHRSEDIGLVVAAPRPKQMVSRVW